PPTERRRANPTQQRTPPPIAAVAAVASKAAWPEDAARLISPLAAQHRHDGGRLFRVAGLATDDQLVRDRDQLDHAVGEHLVDFALQVAVFLEFPALLVFGAFHADVVAKNFAAVARKPEREGRPSRGSANQLELSWTELHNFQNAWIGHGKP